MNEIIQQGEDLHGKSSKQFGLKFGKQNQLCHSQAQDLDFDVQDS